MINLAISLGIGVVLFAAIALWLSPVAAIIPALGVSAIAMFFLSRRVAKRVEVALAEVVPLLQARKVDLARRKLEGIKEQYGRWQFLLEGQLDAQLGMIEYLQMNWDQALPKLEKGKWRNWTALMCIGAIHFRKGRKEQAWEAFDKAANAAHKEVVIYGVWAALLVRDNQRAEALKVVARGLKSQPDSQLLKDLKQKVANKKKIKPKMFGEQWFQFFPEDMAKEMLMRGRRGGQPGMAQPRMGARSAPRR
ncbi:MAG: hypothetical protein KTR31_20800 [Myxococcales bacterium]|nr:hypothetical protein [Myxococcales bacterium]